MATPGVARTLTVRTSQDAHSKRRSIDTVDTNVVSSYLTSLQRFPQLKHDEVVELFKEYNSGVTRDGDGDVLSRTPKALRIRNRLTECNLRLVVSIAKKYKGHQIPIEDLIQEGNIGLMKAIDRFKHEKGFRFSTYATWWIRQAIGQLVLKRKRMIRLPAHAATIQRKMLQAAETYRDANDGREPTDEELMDLVGASETVIKATMHSGRGTVSLNQPVHSANEDTIEDKIQDDNPGCDPFKNVSEKQLFDIVEDVVSRLSHKEAAILRLRFGLCEDPTNSSEYPITEEEAIQVMQGKGLT